MTSGLNNMGSHVNHNLFLSLILVVSVYAFILFLIGTSIPMRVTGQSGFGQDKSVSLSDSNYLTYQNEFYGIELTYPDSWVRTFETGMETGYFVTFDSNQGASLRVIFKTVGDIPPDVYNQEYYGLVRQNSQIDYSNPIILGGSLPGGIMSYTTPCINCHFIQDLYVLESWGKYYNTGYLHFKFVANDFDSFRTYSVPASAIVGSLTLTSG